VDALIAQLLKLTSEDDRRLRSKHGEALRFAAARQITPGKLVRFLKKRGGLNACAERFRKLRNK
jgi:hypothetical protein